MTTKQIGILSKVLTSLSILLNAGPLACYVVIALTEANLTHEKVALVSTVFIVLILTAISFVNKIVLRSRLWILLIGLYCCLDYILTPLLIVAICQVLDEIIVSPLAKHFKARHQINKEIDRRM
jgi:hypothetical protein